MRYLSLLISFLRIKKLTYNFLLKVIKSYGLIQETNGEGGKLWSVNEKLLHQASKKSEPEQEAVDLPSKKDFVRRAKVVITKTLARLRSTEPNKKLSAKNTNDTENSETNGYTVIDQGYQCNILLAEMVRALVKGSTRTSSQMRVMVSYKYVVFDFGSIQNAKF